MSVRSSIFTIFFKYFSQTDEGEELIILVKNYFISHLSFFLFDMFRALETNKSEAKKQSFFSIRAHFWFCDHVHYKNKYFLFRKHWKSSMTMQIPLKPKPKLNLNSPDNYFILFIWRGGRRKRFQQSGHQLKKCAIFIFWGFTSNILFDISQIVSQEKPQNFQRFCFRFCVYTRPRSAA